MRLNIFLQILFLISSISCITSENVEKNMISIKVQSVLNQPTVFINNISEPYFSQIALYLDGKELSNFDRKVPVSDGKLHHIVLIFPKNFRDNCERMFWRVEKVKEIKFINFKGCTSTEGMFSGMPDLTRLDLEEFNTSLVTNMAGMFFGCKSLKTLDLKNFDTSKVTTFKSMFAYLFSLTIYKI